MLRFQAIAAKRAPIGTDGVADQIERILGSTGFAGAMIRRMADYPPQRSRSGYVRTGTLGRNWRMRGPRRTATSIVVEAANATEYAVYVEGPKTGTTGRRQTRVMRNLGWPNITDQAQQEWNRGGHRVRIVRILTQQDAQTRARRRRF